jgi:hypothetical protein
MSDINPPLPDQGPTDGTHGEGAEDPEESAPEPALTEDGSLSPGSTATGSPTSRD